MRFNTGAVEVVFSKPLSWVLWLARQRLGEGGICVLFRKSIHYAPPIKKPDDGVNALPGLLSSTICRPDKMRMHRHQAKHYSIRV
jgi:hypothetical protein